MNIALIAHDGKKKLMQGLCIAYKHILEKNNVYATGTTGLSVEDATGLTVNKYLAGNMGGVNQLSSQVAHNDIDLVIFLRDPIAQNHNEPDIEGLIRLCDIHNIPFASNLATAEALLVSMDNGGLEWRDIGK